MARKTQMLTAEEIDQDARESLNSRWGSYRGTTSRGRSTAAPVVPPLRMVEYPDVERAYRAFMRRDYRPPLWVGI